MRSCIGRTCTGNGGLTVSGRGGRFVPREVHGERRGPGTGAVRCRRIQAGMAHVDGGRQGAVGVVYTAGRAHPGRPWPVAGGAGRGRRADRGVASGLLVRVRSWVVVEAALPLPRRPTPGHQGRPGRDRGGGQAVSADRRREAAKVLLERAEAATQGPWEATDSFGHDAGRAYVVPCDPEIPTYVSAGGSPDEDRDAEYIATMHPGVGLALADWLDTVGADEWAHGPSCLTPCDECDDDPYAPHARRALAIADLILGGKS